MKWFDLSGLLFDLGGRGVGRLVVQNLFEGAAFSVAQNAVRRILPCCLHVRRERSLKTVSIFHHSHRLLVSGATVACAQSCEDADEACAPHFGAGF